MYCSFRDTLRNRRPNLRAPPYKVAKNSPANPCKSEKIVDTKCGNNCKNTQFSHTMTLFNLRSEEGSDKTQSNVVTTTLAYYL